MNKPKGDNFRERAKRHYLQEGINVGRKKGTAHLNQRRLQSMKYVIETAEENFIQMRMASNVRSSR